LNWLSLQALYGGKARLVIEEREPQGVVARVESILKRFYEGRTRTINCITKLVEDAVKSGKIVSNEKPEFISRNIFFLYAGAVRWWIAAERPSLARGIADLKRVFALQVKGVKAATEPAKT
jgi:hypothetical protein